MGISERPHAEKSRFFSHKTGFQTKKKVPFRSAYHIKQVFRRKKRFLLDRPILKKNGGLFGVTYPYWSDAGVCPFSLRRDRPVWSVY